MQKNVPGYIFPRVQAGWPYVFANDLVVDPDPARACSFCGDAEESSNVFFFWLFRIVIQFGLGQGSKYHFEEGSSEVSSQTRNPRFSHHDNRHSEFPPRRWR